MLINLRRKHLASFGVVEVGVTPTPGDRDSLEFRLQLQARGSNRPAPLLRRRAGQQLFHRPPDCQRPTGARRHPHPHCARLFPIRALLALNPHPPQSLQPDWPHRVNTSRSMLIKLEMKLARHKLYSLIFISPGASVEPRYVVGPFLFLVSLVVLLDAGPLSLVRLRGNRRDEERWPPGSVRRRPRVGDDHYRLAGWDAVAMNRIRVGCGDNPRPIK